MSDIFVFGSLADLSLLEIVLGRGLDDLNNVPARLRDHGVFTGPDEGFVRLHPKNGQTVSGLLLRGLGQVETARLTYFAAVFGNDPKVVTLFLADGTAVPGQVFSPQETPDREPIGQAWLSAEWVEKWRAMAVRVAIEIMTSFGQLDARQVTSRLPGIRIRAAAWVAAQARPVAESRDLARDIVVHAHHYPYSNFFAAQEMDLQYRRYDGTLSPVLNRGAQVLGQAVVVLPYDPVHDTVLMVEQFRAPVFIGGDRAPWVWQPVAGLIDPGETPQNTAFRETMEEAGVHLRHLESVASVYSSPGISSEFVHIFVGLADLSDVPERGGLVEEGEDIRSQIIGYDALMDGIDRGTFRDMPLVTTALWLARHRDRLRITA